MAINITEGYMDGEKQVSRSGEEQQQRDPVSFHKHCQKTVCSAFGYSGNGATWNILTGDNAGDDIGLPNIQSYLTGTETVKQYFTKNSNNITEDLRSILELINLISGKVVTQKSWKLVFKDCGGKKIVDPDVTINPWSGGSQEYNFTNIGRFLTLNVDGHPLKFHTIHEFNSGYESEVLSIDLPKNDLTINFNGDEVGVASNIYMPNSATIDIKQDFNQHPTSGYSGHLPGGAPIDGTYHVIRHHQNGGSITPTFIIDTKYVQSENPEAPIVEWEFHLKNISSTNMTVNDPVVKVGDDTNWFNSTTALTDQMYVEPGKTNVYVFRADMYDSPMSWGSSARALTYSLAYVY